MFVAQIMITSVSKVSFISIMRVLYFSSYVCLRHLPLIYNVCLKRIFPMDYLFLFVGNIFFFVCFEWSFKMFFATVP